MLADAFSPGLPRRSVRYLLLGVVGGAALSLTGLAGIAYGLPLSASTVTALGITGAVGLPLSAHAATVLDDA